MASFDPGTLTDPVALTRALVDVESVSGDEREIADAVEAALRGARHLSVERHGNTVVARTDLGRPTRVALAGHLDTVPLADNFPSRLDGDVIYGCGTSDMKSGTAVALWLAVGLAEPRHDVTYLFYDCEEVESARNGLNKLAASRPDLLAADFAVLLEPTYGQVEAGCQGTMRALVTTTGRRAHSARSWLGDNAVHAAGEVLRRLSEYRARTVVLDGCEYREGLNAVRITGGIAGNVIPDVCRIEVNYRFAPDRSEADAEKHLREVFTGYDVRITDSAPGALPGLDGPAVRQFLATVDQPATAKLGWTDVARFAALGIPAVNFGPGDPNLAHKPEERVEIPKITGTARILRDWLG
ncbi:MAG TPA: succinyl-diaminopimelate desuccinylase [Micromonosporaceae bacterium]